MVYGYKKKNHLVTGTSSLKVFPPQTLQAIETAVEMRHNTTYSGIPIHILVKDAMIPRITKLN